MWTLGSVLESLVGVAIFGSAAWLVDATRWSWIPDWALAHVWWMPIAYAAFAVAETILSPRWRYRIHRWEVTQDIIYTRSGWFRQKWQMVPVSRIQTVDHTQNWLERRFRLATLRVQTASHAGSSTIAGLDAAEAERLSGELAIRAGELRDDAT